MKRTTRRLIAAGLGAAALLLAVLLAAMAFMRRPLVVGLYGIDDVQGAALARLAQDPAIAGKPGFRLKKLDGARPLAVQIGSRTGPDLILALEGRALTEAAAALAPMDGALTAILPSTIRQAGKTGDTHRSVALALNHFELAWDRAAFSAAGLGEITNLAGILSSGLVIKNRLPKGQAEYFWPLLIAGGDDDELLLLASALVESRGGTDAWRKLSQALASASGISSVLDTPLGNDLSLRSALNELVSWKALGLMHPEWHRMKTADIAAFMERKQAPLILMSLAMHRAMPPAHINRYASGFFPAADARQARGLAAPLLMGAAVQQSPRRKKALALLASLLSEAGQKKLCAASGLAPAAAAVEAEDIQASDARLWVAASEAALPDLGSATQPSLAARAALAAELRQYLQSGGMGF